MCAPSTDVAEVAAPRKRSSMDVSVVKPVSRKASIEPKYEDPDESIALCREEKKKKIRERKASMGMGIAAVPKQKSRRSNNVSKKAEEQVSVSYSERTQTKQEDVNDDISLCRKAKEKKKKIRERRASMNMTPSQEVVVPSHKLDEDSNATSEAKRNKEKKKKKKERRSSMATSQAQHDFVSQDVSKPASSTDPLQAKILSLRQKLDKIQKERDAEIEKIKKESDRARREFKEQAAERAKKNQERNSEKDDLQLAENQKIISALRSENTDIRTRNDKLYQSIENIKINNQRLKASNAQTDECYNRLRYHEDSCETENKKLVKLDVNYKKAVDEHTEHVELYTAYGEAEVNIKRSYNRLLTDILGLIENDDNEQLIDEIRAMAEELEWPIV